MGATNHGAIIQRAGEQLGLITRQQLFDIGVTPRQLRTLAESGVLRRLRRGIYGAAAHPTGPRQRLLAATLAAGPGAVASHLTAAWIWGFDGLQPDGMELSVPADRRPRLPDVAAHRSSDLLQVDVTTHGGQPVTTPARTLLDIAGLVTCDELEEAFDGARRRGQIYLPFLEWRLAQLRRQGRAGVGGLEELLARELASAKAESWLESAFLRLIRDAFLPPPRVQVVTSAGGDRRVRLDAFYDDQRLVAEVNGHGSHATRRQRQADAARRARLVTAGLRVIDFTYEDVRDRPEYVAGTLATVLDLDAP